MCGIFAAFNIVGDYTRVRSIIIKMLKRISHRGPDQTGLTSYPGNSSRQHHFICHQRLSMVDQTTTGEQPFFTDDKKICGIGDGEIYNHMKLREKLVKKHTFRGTCDCEIIPHYYEEFGMEELCKSMSGKFGVVIFDSEQDRFFVGRDHLGIIPVYVGRGTQGEFFVCSELKAFHDFDSVSIEILKPGHYYDSKEGKQIRWYNPIHYNMELVPTKPVDYSHLRNLLIESVRTRLMVDVPFGVLLSGGLDSSIVASITQRLYDEYLHKHADHILVTKKLHSFCIGLEGSPDLKSSREVADFLKTEHHEMTFTVEEGIDAISEVIYHIETFNPTTIRASTPMYLMSRKIKALGIKMILSGEGADAIFGGYLYFHKAPNAKEFHMENIRLLQDAYKYDLLRANKSCASWGIEARLPFMDKGFVEYAMSFDPSEKMITPEHKNIEKWVLREAFNCKEDPYLPESVLWRQKEQFSDGVGYSWVDGLKEHIEKEVSDEDFKNAEIRFPLMTPPTKEAYYYRMIYESHYPSISAVSTVPQNKSIACSTEKALEWDEKFKANADESGRAVKDIHKSTKMNK